MTDEEANEEVPCPACKGLKVKGIKCRWCEDDGVVKRWVALAITTDGVVR